MTVIHGLEPRELAAISVVRRAARLGVTRRVRELAGLSLEEMGRSAGVAPQSVLRWECGARSPRTGAAARYAAAITALVATLDDAADPSVQELRAALTRGS